jgi:hypothetical protein
LGLEVISTPRVELAVMAIPIPAAAEEEAEVLLQGLAMVVTAAMDLPLSFLVAEVAQVEIMRLELRREMLQLRLAVQLTA